MKNYKKVLYYANKKILTSNNYYLLVHSVKLNRALVYLWAGARFDFARNSQGRFQGFRKS